MAETYGFYDTEELVDGTYDREYIAQQWADYFKLFIGTGVFASPTNQLKVVAGEGMNIIVKEGWAFIEGRWYHNDADLILPVQPNATASTITSGVFIQADSANRVIKAIIATGRTTPDREAPYYELELAQIQLATGTTAITNSMITDMRTDESVCGFVKGLLEGIIPTADLFIQFTDMFNTWFDTIKDQLSEDAAGHLQNEIDSINENVADLGERVDECFQSASEGKTLIASALAGKGQSSTSADTFAQMANKINNLMAVPTATKNITSNGNNIDVLNFSKANINVPTYKKYTYTVSVGTTNATITLTKPDGSTISRSVTVASNNTIFVGPVSVFAWEHDNTQVSFHGAGYLNSVLINAEGTSAGSYSTLRIVNWGSTGSFTFEVLVKA